MALSTRTVNNTFFGNSRNENNKGGTYVSGKPATRASNRSALASIQNIGGDVGQQQKKPQLKPSRILQKSKATTALQAIHEVQRPKVKAPSPMEVVEVVDPLSRLNYIDIDKLDIDNPQLVSDYANDIYDYMRDLERAQCVRANYMGTYEINARMRGILVDWLVQVHSRFHLLQETLFLTVAIVDRFLQLKEVTRNKLQLVGVTSMLLASKYEEMFAPEIANFVYITDNAYTQLEIRKMECIILKALEFNLGRPLPLHFLRRNSKAGQVDAKKRTLAKYLVELTLTDYNMVQYHPSQVAGGALCLAMKLLDESEWCDTLHYYSKYSEQELSPVVSRIAQLVLKSEQSKLQAIRTKYMSTKFMKISTIPELQSDVLHELHYEDDLSERLRRTVLGR